MDREQYHIFTTHKLPEAEYCYHFILWQFGQNRNIPLRVKYPYSHLHMLANGQVNSSSYFGDDFALQVNSLRPHYYMQRTIKKKFHARAFKFGLHIAFDLDIVRYGISCSAFF